MSKYLWPIVAGILLVSVSGPAGAQPARGMYYSYHRWYETPAENIARSNWYDHLLEVNLSFRHFRMHVECGPIIHDHALRHRCLESFAKYEPVSPYARYYGWPWRHHWHHWYR